MSWGPSSKHTGYRCGNMDTYAWIVGINMTTEVISLPLVTLLDGRYPEKSVVTMPVKSNHCMPHR